MKRLIRKKKPRIFLLLLALLAGGACYSALNMGFWLEDSYTFREMSRNYEASELFFRQVDTILEHKIHGQQNTKLFEEDGEFAQDREIDIQSFGDSYYSVRDMNTTYLLGDLLKFNENGGREKLHEAITSAMEQQSQSGREAGEILDEQAQSLETILPVTGISLSECARWYSDPADYVLDSYLKLDEISGLIYERYLEYTNEQDESWLADAPCNLLYYIENTATGEIYTNTSADSLDTAKERIQRKEDFVQLYEGERSFNIMVADQENILNQDAADWFMQERFVNANEKILLAVDTAYPVSDELRLYADIFAKRETLVWLLLAIFLICSVLAAVGLILIVAGTAKGGAPASSVEALLDRLPTEIAGGVYAVAGLLFALFFSTFMTSPSMMYTKQRILVSAGVALAYLVALSASCNLMKRIGTRTLWENSVCIMLVRIWRQVTSARAASGQLLFFFIIFAILNFLFLSVGSAGILLMVIMDMVVLLYLLRDMAGKQSIYEGLRQISKGDLSYKIDISVLSGETYELAKAVNEMGDGLYQAVDAIIKNERLKAELITNVSHDIKTPLTSIVNYVDLLKRENLEGERVQHYIEVLDQKSQRLKQLTEDLVEASKISSGNVELHMVKIQLQSMIRQAYGEFQERLEEHSLITVWNMEKEPVDIMADGRQFWRILENLFGNIYKYAMEGTRVYIELYREDRTAYLILQNTARETPDVAAEELMGRFVRGDRSRNTEGSGLGLSIARSLAELQGGTFHLELEGDTFKAILNFPVVEEE